MLIKHDIIDGVSVGHLGSLHLDALLIVVGRSNYKKSSSSIDSIIRNIHEQGMSVCWFETRETQTAKLLDEQFINSGASRYCDNSTIFGQLLRKLAKTLLLLRQPTQWNYFRRILKTSNYYPTRDLVKFINNFPNKEIYLLSHSAGGITSSLIASENSVVKLICFGYPFKNPKKPDEPIRTSHLSEIKKLFLIIQGDADEYGTIEDSNRYQLSPSTHVISIKSGHDYDNLASHEYSKAKNAIAKFIALR